MVDEKKGIERNNLALVIMFCIIALGTGLAHIANINVPIVQDKYHSFRTTETAIVIQDYFRNGLSFFNYSMPLFGKPWNVMFEFPTYQALVYGIMRLFGATNIDFWARIVSIIIFYVCSFVLIRFVSCVTNKTNAYCVGMVFLLSAFNLYWSSAVLIDYLSVSFGMLYLLCLCICVNDIKPVVFAVGIASGIVGYMTKGTTFFPIVVFAALYIICHEWKLFFARKERITVLLLNYLKNNIKRIIYILLLAIVPAFCGLLWTKYVDGLKEMSVYTSWLSSRNGIDWYYGTFQQKMTLSNWLPILSRYESFFGNRWLLLAVVLVYVIFSSRKYWKIVVFSFVAQISTVFILFNLFYVHNYYLIELVPFAYLMFGTMLYEISKININYSFLKKMLMTMIFFIYIVFQISFNQDYIDGVIHPNSEIETIGNYINTITLEDELIVIMDEDWTPITLYDANRRGFMARDCNLLYDEEFRHFLKDDNYSTYVAHSSEGVDAINDLDIETEQYALESCSQMNDKSYIFKEINDKKKNDYANNIKAYDNSWQPIEEISDGQSFSIRYSIDYTAGIFGHIIDKNDETHNFFIVLPSKDSIAKINYSLVCAEPSCVCLDNSEELQISFVY